MRVPLRVERIYAFPTNTGRTLKGCGYEDRRNMIKKFICIRCPEGCEITTTLDGNGAITEITGNSCKLGIEHVKAEVTDPRRTLTTTVMVEGGSLPLCPVWTEKPVPKDKVLAIAETLRNVKIEAPVNMNQVVIENVLGTGINVITSRQIMKL
jgi:CxxC motif-containing protein